MKKRRYAASLAVFTMSAILFSVIAWRVIASGPVSALDRAAMGWANAIAAPWLTNVMMGATYLGGPSATSVFAGLLIGYLVLSGQRIRLAVAVAGIVYGGMLLNVVLKHIFERARPAIESPVITLTTYSFPSGHAAASTVFSGLLCVLAIRSESCPAGKALVIVAATIWVGLVCTSRVYFGLHYVTDVLAGIMEGVAWLALSTLVLERFRSPAAQTPS